MLGLLVLGLTAIMIYTLVKNALVGKQLSQADSTTHTIAMIVPVTAQSELNLAAWSESIHGSQFGHGQVKIHILIDGHNHDLNQWQSLQTTMPYIEIHSLSMRPDHAPAIPWMIDQIAPRITADVVIIADSELVPTQHAFFSIADTVLTKKRPYFVVPQTAKTNLLGEAIAVINPTLAFTSFFGMKKWRRNITHPLIGISQGWMAMELATFKEIDFKAARLSNWKEFISRQWEEKKVSYFLAFGEKHLIRFYPANATAHMLKLKAFWEELWEMKTKAPFVFYSISMFIWAFPILCFITHPFQALASFFLLVLYRFFSKIVFQESWGSIVLHFVGSAFWIGALGWFASDKIRAKYFNKKNQGMN